LKLTTDTLGGLIGRIGTLHWFSTIIVQSNAEMEKEEYMDFDIDLIYLWCDGNDPEFIMEKNKYITGKESNYGVQEQRFFENDELRYSIRSAMMYIPWIRNIFIVTNNQIPRWIDANNPRIRIVNQSDIIDDELNPVFNSAAIEFNFYKIKDLSEHFIYANDDMFVGKSLEKSFFFDMETGFPNIDVLSSINCIKDILIKNNFSMILKSNEYKNSDLYRKREILMNKFTYEVFKDKDLIGFSTSHQFQAYLKSALKEDVTMPPFNKIFKLGLKERFRGKNFVPRIMIDLIEGNKKRANLITRDRGIMYYTKLDYLSVFFDKPTLFCINELDNSKKSELESILEQRFLNQRFNRANQFEILPPDYRITSKITDLRRDKMISAEILKWLLLMSFNLSVIIFSVSFGRNYSRKIREILTLIEDGRPINQEDCSG